MRVRGVAVVLCLLLVYGCGKQEEGGCVYPDCQIVDDGFFLLENLGGDFGETYWGITLPIDATLVEMPFTGTSGCFILRGKEGNEYRLKPLRYETEFDIEWEEQLDGLRLGKTYRFVFSISPYGGAHIIAMKVFDGESLLYLAASYIDSAMTYYGFRSTELEGFTAEQLDKSEYPPELQGKGLVSRITSLPVVFRYGDQSVTLYQTEEATLTTPQGDYLVHLLRSVWDSPQNYDNGGCFYSFYIERI